MISPARRVCFDLLCRIESRGIFSDDAINSAGTEKLERRDRNLTTEIIYGCLRWQAMLDYILSKASARPWNEVHPRARVLLRMSAYQMWKMDRIPDHALVNDAVELAKLSIGRGIDRYINGVLRRLTGTRPWNERGFASEAPLWTQVSIPQWLWDRWASRFGENDAKTYALSLNSLPQIAGRLPESVSETHCLAPSDLVPGAWIQLRCGSGEDADPPDGFRRQDEASQLIPHLFGPVEGWAVWDCCAAPGGKSAILSAKCGQSGLLIASDLQCRRIPLLTDSLKGAVCNSDCLVADASLFPPFSRKFDAVLADVPCSGLGTLRRNPEIKWNFAPEEFDSLQRIQTRILEASSKAVRIGGLLLYSTCSTEPEENEIVVQSFLRSHPEFVLKQPSFPEKIGEWTGSDGMVRTYPSSRLWDGLFAALLVRTRE